MHLIEEDVIVVGRLAVQINQSTMVNATVKSTRYLRRRCILVWGFSKKIIRSKPT